MPFRTYIPALLFIVGRLCVYTARYDSQIRANLSPGAIGAYNALRAACDVFVSLVPQPPQGD